MTYEAWRIIYQSPEHAARAAWYEAQQLKIDLAIVRQQRDEWREAAKGRDGR